MFLNQDKFYSEGLAAFCLNSTWGFMDEQENIVIQPVYDEVR
ncbi:MAG: WG repeat-containing protein, partial [Clostridia bacterium]|nr:WG repeat-containing protein [Clostridia bacterium]